MKSLQQYIAALEQAGELVRIRAFVDPVLEIAEVTDRVVKSAGGGKALLFENTGTAFPVVTNLYGSPARMCRALGIESYGAVERELTGLFASLMQPKTTLWDKLKLLPVLRQAAQWMPKIASGRGACQQVVMPQPDLRQLPVLHCWPHDGGRFITLPMVHTKDPATGARNVGMYRMQVFSHDTTGMHWHRHKTGARHFAASAQLPGSRRFPVAVALGGDPLYAYCATAPMPDNVDEYLLAGFLRRRPVELVRCLTQPLEIPADADFVIEGYIDTHEPPATEGPFGDHTGFYSLEDRYPLLHVTCITHRRQAVYPATVVGVPPQEDACMAQATERIFLTPVRMAIAPEIVDMHMPPEGVVHNVAIVKIKKEYPGQAVKVAHSLWGAGQMMFNKILIVVDGDVELTDYPALLRHLAQHYRPATGTYFSHGPLDVLDHAAATPAMGGKLCLDATQGDDNAPPPDTVDSRLEACIRKGNRIPDARIVGIFDEQVDIHNFAACLWLLGNNIDVARDCRVEHNRLIIDATTKAAQIAPRRWPEVVCADGATIAAVDAKWPLLGLGEQIVSPSIAIRHLVQGATAAVAFRAPDKPPAPTDTACYHSPVGWLRLEAGKEALHVVAFCDSEAPVAEVPANPILQACIRQLDEYFAGRRRSFDLPLAPSGTAFQRGVWQALAAIPYGQTISYLELARRIGNSKAVRAVGRANGQNKIVIIVPCHRVIGAHGTLVGYTGGLWRKEWLLKHEQR